jgi:chromosome segregation ATPase
VRQYSDIGKEEQKEIAALERELERVAHEAEKNQLALGALDEQRREREGRLAMARRAQQELEQALDHKRAELERAEAAFALDLVKQALEERDGAARGFAEAAESVLARLQAFDAAQERVEDASDALPAGAVELAGERNAADDRHARPAAFTDALSMLSEAVGDRVATERDRDLVEAAARSPMGQEIRNLPQDLQELARARYLARGRELRRRDSARGASSPSPPPAV